MIDNNLNPASIGSTKKTYSVCVILGFFGLGLLLSQLALAQPTAAPQESASPNPSAPIQDKAAAPATPALPIPLPPDFALPRRPSRPSGPKFLSPEQERLAVANELAFMKMEDLGTTKISLSVRNASVDDIIAAVHAATNKPVEIENRNVAKIAINLAVKDTEITRILKAAASLAGAELFVLPDHFLIAAPQDLHGNEHPDKTLQNVEGQRDFRHMLFGRSVVGEFRHLGIDHAKLKELNAPLAGIVQDMVNISDDLRKRPRTALPPDAEVSVEQQGKMYAIKIWLWSQRQGYLYGIQSEPLYDIK